jgi:hypothetical protein
MALGLVLGSAAIITARATHGIVAQDDATPGAQVDATPGTEGADDTGSTGGDPVVGDTVLFINDDGEAAANLTVDEVIIGFEDFGEFFTPEAGATYVAVALTVENLDTDDDAFQFVSFYVGLQTEDGLYYTPTFVFFDAETAEEYPEIKTGDIEAGGSASGYLFFAIPDDKEAARLFYSPSRHLLLLANVRDIEPALRG